MEVGTALSFFSTIVLVINASALNWSYHLISAPRIKETISKSFPTVFNLFLQLHLFTDSSHSNNEPGSENYQNTRRYRFCTRKSPKNNGQQDVRFIIQKITFFISENELRWTSSN